MTHSTKRLLAMLITVLVLIAVVPVAFPGSLGYPVLYADTTDKYVRPTADSTAAVELSTANDWLHFANDSTGSDGTALFKGKTVRLLNDIDLSNIPADGAVAKPVPSVKGFEGNFDGQNHIITIPDGGQFYGNGTGALGPDAGLFRQINNGGTVQNLIVQLKGELLLSDNANTYHAGVVAGIVANNSKLQNVAVIGANNNSQFTIKYPQVVDTPYYRYYGTILGYLCGVPDSASGGSTVSGCFSDVNLYYEDPLYINGQVPAFLGGITGYISGDNSVLQDCIYRGQKINFQAKKDQRLDTIGSLTSIPNAAVCEGGISGVAANSAKIMNCFVFEPTFSFNNLSPSGFLIPVPMPQYYGKIVGMKQETTQVTNCHGMGGVAFTGTTHLPIIADNTGSVTAAPKAATLGTVWTDTIEGYPNLKWLTSAPTSVNVDAKSATPTLAINPSYPNSDGSYDPNNDANWVFDISIPVRGKMPTPPESVILESAVEEVKVTPAPSISEFYKGGNYHFGAEVIGIWGNDGKPAISWSAASNGTAISMSADGALNIPSNFSGTSIVVTASCKGKTGTYTVNLPGAPPVTVSKDTPLPKQTIKPLQGQAITLKAVTPTVSNLKGWSNWKVNGEETTAATSTYTYEYTVPSGSAPVSVKFSRVATIETPAPGGSGSPTTTTTTYEASFDVQPQQSVPQATKYTDATGNKSVIVKISDRSGTELGSLKGFYQYRLNGTAWTNYSDASGIELSTSGDSVSFAVRTNNVGSASDKDYSQNYDPSGELTYTVRFDTGSATCSLTTGEVAASQAPFNISVDGLPYLVDNRPPASYYISGNANGILEAYNTKNLTSYTRSAGTITVKNVRASKMPFSTAATARFQSVVQPVDDDGGQRTQRPVIKPTAGQTIDPTQGVWIEYPGTDSAQIYYTVTPDGSNTTAVDPTEGEVGRTKIFKSGDKILFPQDSDVFEVRAIAKAGSKLASDVVSIIYRRDTSFESPDTPKLLLGDAKTNYSYEQTYPADSAIHFAAPSEGEEIYFTINGTTPTKSSTKYDVSNPTKLTSVSGRTTVTVMAIIYNTATKRSSAVATYIVRIMQSLSVPAVNLDPGQPVRPNQDLLLSLSDDTLKQLDANGTYQLKRVTYQHAGDTNNTDYNEFGDGVTVTGSPIAGTQYISYREDESMAFALPDIKYLVGDGDVTTSGILYAYGIRKVTYSEDAGYSVVYTNPQTVKLTGSPDASVKVQAYTISPNALYKDSSVVTYNYKIRGAVSAPTSYPPTDNAELAALKVGDGVVLASSANTKIFYTLDSSLPSVSYDPVSKSWVPQNESTLEFTDNIDITSDMVTKRIFAINAIAVHVNDELESSPPTTFRYRLPDPVKAVIANPSGGAVIKDTKVKLSCLTEGATIYYTTDGVTQPGASADQVYIYDPENPPVIKKDVTIITRAEKEGVSSDVKTYAFTMSPVLPAPLASLPTGSAVCKGTRIKLSAQGSIAYTIDGSDPKAAVAAGGDEASAVNYGDSVVLDADYGKSITIRAYATRDGYSPSEVASYTYTVCKQEDYLTAVPASGGTVIAGTTITLSTSVTNGKIYYATGGNVPIAANVYTDDVDEDDEDDDDSVSTFDGEYKWAAGSKTSRGNTVKASGNPGDTFTIRALVVADGSQNGTISLFTYKLTERTPSPTASIPSGAITLSGAEVTLTGKEGDIFYTTDGTTPTTSSTLYTKPIPITDSIVLKAIAIAKDKVASEVVEYTYTRAGQAAAVTMSVPSGEVEQGTKLELKSETQGAAIYYTTDGSEPGKSSLVYSAPISLMRPVTIKAIAVMEGLDNSVVNSASYTVTEPVPVEEETDNASQVQTTQTDRLESRRTYAKSGQGNTYTDVVITEPQYNVVLSCTDGIVPQDAQLDIKQVDSSAGEKKAVNSLLGYNIAALYDVNLLKGGEAIQPTGQVEVGIPIPAEYQNGIVVVCRINDDGTAEAFPTRRSGGVAYFMTNHFSRYAVTVPELSRGNISTNFTVIVIASAAVTLLFVLILILVLRRKHVKKK